MLERFITFIAIVALSGTVFLHGQGIEGRVLDTDGNPIPYTSIFIKELPRGTTSNSLGNFSFPLPEGTYTIYFRSLGYSEVSKNVIVSGKMTKLDIVLPPQSYMIPEVTVSASGEDPAYRIMSKTIGLANYHLNQVSTYTAEIYIKGTAYFNKLPRAIAKRIEVNNIKVEENTAYMLESLNEVTYRAPDKYDMRVIASQNTLPGYSESVNPMDYINASLYQPQIESFVSPLARNAFFYYKFSLEGSFLQGNYMINKIKVIPKRKSQQLCSGFLYIVEDLWCLHSSDLAVSTIAGTLYLQQQYANVILDAWLPVSHKLQMEVEIAGVQADVTYVSSLEYKTTVLNANLPKSFFEPQNKPSEEVVEKEPSPEQIKIEEILDKDELSDRDMARLTKLMEKETENADVDKNKLEVEGTKFSIAPHAVMNDSSYWNAIRPVPLTFEETETLSVRDSLMGYGTMDTTARVKDTIRTQHRRKYRKNDLFFGYTFYSHNRRTRLKHEGLLDLSMLGFNAVDGISYKQQFSFDSRPDTVMAYRWNLQAGYAFARKAPLLAWNSDILYAPRIRGKLALRMDYGSSDFNQTSPVPDLTNLAYSLLAKNNLSKKFEKRAIQLEHRMDLATGLVLYTSLEYQNRIELQNNTNFSIIFRDSSYTPNYPSDRDINDAIFDDSRLLQARGRLEYTYEYYYRLRNGRKQYFKSEYPTLYAEFRQAIPVRATGWADFNFICLGLSHVKEVGLLSKLDYKLEGGYYPMRNSMHYSDFTHFNVSPVRFDMAGFSKSFQLMDYYRASTNQYYLEAHAGLTSPYLMLKLLPWFSERLWNETISVSFLQTQDINQHIQLGYSLNEIGFMFDIGIYTAFEDWKYYGNAVTFNFRF